MFKSGILVASYDVFPSFLFLFLQSKKYLTKTAVSYLCFVPQKSSIQGIGKICFRKANEKSKYFKSKNMFETKEHS